MAVFRLSIMFFCKYSFDLVIPNGFICQILFFSQIKPTGKTSIFSPTNRRRWSAVDLDIKHNVFSDNEDYESDVSTASQMSRQTSKIPKRTNSVRRVRNKDKIYRDSKQHFSRDDSELPRHSRNSSNKNSNQIGKSGKEVDVETYGKSERKTNTKKQGTHQNPNEKYNIEEQDFGCVEKTFEKAFQAKRLPDETNDTDDEKLKKDPRNLSWFVPNSSQDIIKPKNTEIPVRIRRRKYCVSVKRYCGVFCMKHIFPLIS